MLNAALALTKIAGPLMLAVAVLEKLPIWHRFLPPYPTTDRSSK